MEKMTIREKVAAGALVFLLLSCHLFTNGIQSAFFLLCCAGSVFIRRRMPSVYILKTILPLLLVLLLGMTGGVFHDRFGNTFPGAYETLKDGWYLISGVLAFMSGCLLAEQIGAESKLWKAVFWAAVLMAALYLLFFFKTAEESGFENVRAMRMLLGYPPTLAVCFACAALVIQPQLIQRPLLRNMVGALLALCVFVSFSRLLWACTLLMAVSMTGFLFRIRKRVVVRIVVFLIILAPVVFFVIRGFSLEKAFSDMTRKIQGSFVETTFKYDSVGAGYDPRLHRQWRGYEAKRVWSEYVKGNDWEFFLGQGYGAVVDVGFYISLAGTRVRYLPIFHNGYLYVLYKTGILGLFLFLLFLWDLFRQAAKTVMLTVGSGTSMAGRSLLAIALGIVFSTAVMRGYFDKKDATLLILAGAFFAQSQSLLWAAKRKAPEVVS